MRKYIIRRCLYIIIVMAVISIMLFILFENMPGDPVMMWMAENALDLTPEAFEVIYQQTVERMGFDRPVYVRFFRWVGAMASGDMGYSLHHRRPIIDVIRTPIMWTVILSVVSTVTALMITIPLGIFSAVKRGKTFDNAVLVFTVIGFSIPTFTVALIFIVVFSVWLELLPISGMTSIFVPDTAWGRFVDRARHMALPVLTITFVGLAGMTRFVRAQMIEVLSEDYIRTARAKGLVEKVVIFSHAFRNALIPMVTLLTGTFIGLFSGSVVIETLFNWSGMGRIMLDSIVRMDYGVTLSMGVFYAFVAIIAIFFMDLAYGLVDPRVRVSK